MSTSTPDFSSMTAAEIKAFIESQPQPEPEATEEEQPRDDRGRFTSAEESIPTVNETEETQTEEQTEEETVPEMYVREIDLGDGSGVQVFKAPTLEELADKLADAQAHATRKIRELSQRPVQPQPTSEQTLIDDTTFSQRLLTEPTAVVREIMQKEFGMTPAEVRQRLDEANAAAKAQAADAAAREWTAATPDYYMCETNGRRIIRWLELNGKEGTVDNIQAAYDDLTRDGLLVSKPVAKPAPRSSGISTRRSAAAPVKTAAEVKRDLSKLSREQLLELAGGYQNPY
jgi:hypothetical protein